MLLFLLIIKLIWYSSARNEFVEKCLNIVLSFILIRLGLETFLTKMEAIEAAGKVCQFCCCFYTYIVP